MPDFTPATDALLAELAALRQRVAELEDTPPPDAALQALLDATTDLACLLDIEGRVVASNAAMAARVGLSKEAFLGTYVMRDLLPPAVAAQRWERFQQALATAQDVRWTDTRDGRILENTLQPILGADGQVRQVAVFARDVTDERLAQQAAIFRAHLLDAVEQAVIATDPRGHVIYWNRFAERLYGYTAEEALGRTTMELIAGSDRHHDESAALMEALARGAKWSGELWLRNKAGDEFPIQATDAPILNEAGEMVGIVGVSMDISARKAAEQALQQSNDLLSAFIRHSPIHAFVKEVTPTASRTLWASENYQEMVGIPGSQMVGKTMQELFPPELAAKITADDQAVVAQGNVLRLDEDLGDRHYTTIKFPIHLGERTLLAGYTVDITEHVRAEQALRESEARYRSLVEGTPDVIMLFDQEHRHLYASPSVEAQTGIPAEAFIGKTHAELGFAPEQCAYWEEQIQSVFRTGKPVETEFGYESQQGPVVLNWRLVPVWDGERVSAALSISRDITQTRLAEERYQTLFDAMLDGFALHEMVYDEAGQPIDYRFVAINPAFERLTGLKAADLIGRTVLEVLPGTEQYWIETYGRVALTGEPAHFEQHHQGLGRRFEVTAYRPAPNQFACVFVDVTEHVRAERALRESEARYRLLADNVSDVIWTMDMEGRFTYVSPSVQDLRGYTPEEVLRQPVVEAVCPGSRGVLEDAMNEARAYAPGSSANDVISVEIEQPRKDGSTVWTEASARLLLDDIGQPSGIIGVSRDISERRRSQLEYRKLLQATTDGFFVLDTHGMFVDVNDAYCALLGYAREELLGLGIQDVDTVESPEATAAHIALIMTTGYDRFETRHRRKDGAILDIEMSVTYLDSGVGRFYCFARDITEHKRAELALQATEELYRSLSELTADYAYIVGVEPDGRRITEWVSPSFARVTGYTLAEYRTLNERLRIVHPDDSAVTEARARRLLNGNLSIDEYRIITKAGDVRWIRSYARGEFDPAAGRVTRIVGAATDITAAKRAQEALAESEARYHNLFEQVADAILVHDTQGRFLDANQVACQRLGYTHDEMLAMNLRQVIDPDPTGRVAERMATILREGSLLFESAHVARDGRVIPIETHVRHIEYGGRPAFLSVSRDTTERKRLEEAVRESERRFRTLFERTPVGYQSLDTDGRLIEVNPTWLEALGYAREEVLGRWVGDYMTPDSQALFRERFPRLKALGETHDAEFEMVRRDGSTFIAAIEGRCIYDAQGQFLHSHCIFVDVTERRKSEQALRRWAQVFEHAGWGISVGDARTESLALVNPAFARMFGYTAKELEHLPVERLYSPSERAAAQEHLREAHLHEHHTWESVMRRKDGTEFPALVDITVVYDDAGQPDYRVANVQDLTERKSLEAQLAQAQKMEAVGRLAGGIAHDFKNLLTVINGYSDMLMDLLPPDDPMGEDLEQIRGAGERAATLTRQLLAFSRRQVMQMRLLDLSAVTDGMAGLLGRIIGEDIALRLELAPALHAVRGDAGQLEQVVMNLAVNARDAMPTGGTLTITTANDTVRQEIVTARAVVPAGDYVTLAIEDTGSGMSAEVREHLFEPFYTTKEVGKGTGLGLAMVYGIVKQSGGEILVESEEGRGTTFTVYLPAMSEEARKGAPTGPEALPLGRETILVVEDEEAVRTLTVRLLRELGYGVMEAASGPAAIELFLATRRQIDLVLTDTVMPGMSGPEMVQELRHHRPDLQVLFTSGYTDGTALRHGMDEAEEAFLQKPFTRGALARLLREVLDG
jgi:PAS domain S-box-containing protein